MEGAKERCHLVRSQGLRLPWGSRQSLTGSLSVSQALVGYRPALWVHTFQDHKPP